MFTIRVDRTDGTREGRACLYYRVLGSTGIELYETDTGPTLVLGLEQGDRAYVMNARGNTIDQVATAVLRRTG